MGGGKGVRKKGENDEKQARGDALRGGLTGECGLREVFP